MIDAFTDSCLLQLLQQCLFQFLCLPLKLLPRLTSQRRVKRRRRQREELGKRLRGPPNRARRERWGSRLPQANLKLSPVSCSQVLEHPGGWHHVKSDIVFLWRKLCVSCVVSGEEAPWTYPGWQPRGFKKTGKETGKTTGWLLYVFSLKTLSL